jgi:hypothetical protein
MNISEFMYFIQVFFLSLSNRELLNDKSNLI